MADAGESAYREIRNYLPENIEIIKVGHHGANKSINGEMIKKLNPKYALISAGNNIFNHPHYTTINLLNDNDVKILTTKEYGFVKCVLKDNENKFYYFDKKLKKLKKLDFPNNNENEFHKSSYIKEFVEKNKGLN